MNSQRGAGSGLTVCIAIVVIMVAIVAAVHGSWLASGQHARSSADLSALAAGREHALGGDGCEKARITAKQQSARVTSCELTSGFGEFVIDVTVEVDLIPAIPGAPQTSTASAKAGIIEGVG